MIENPTVEQIYELSKHKRLVIVAGYAGTGKTTMICELSKYIKSLDRNLKVAYVSFTGKAASVLREKLEKSGALFDIDFHGTIHSLMYIPQTKYDTRLKTFVLVGWKRREYLDYDIVVIDEASMVSSDIFSDLYKSYKCKIFAFGDHGQLPPVKSSFNLLKDPDFVLSKVHRFDNSSILKLSLFVRQYGYIPEGFFSPSVMKLKWDDNLCQQIWNNIDFSDMETIVLCGFNKTRVHLNNLIREKRGFKPDVKLYVSEKVICVSNDYNYGVMNGQIGKVAWLTPSKFRCYKVTLSTNNSMVELPISKDCFGKETYDHVRDKSDSFRKIARELKLPSIAQFDYGYAISVHKAQGSEWNRVIVFEQRSYYWNRNFYTRWLYTAVTRSKEKLLVITGF